MPFRDIVGHRQVIALLARAGSKGTLPPSLLFSGPAGSGKATTAIALAQALNCERLAPVAPSGRSSADAWDACGECATCRRIARAAAAFREGKRPAIDCLVWLAPNEKGAIAIESVREVIGGWDPDASRRVAGRADGRPLDGRNRLVVIEEADALTVPAQQSLLKALEEPPSATGFVLLTSQPDVLLPTIRSRCPQLRFGPLAEADIVRGLVERFGWTTERALAAAALANGRLGTALGERDPAVVRARDVAAGVLEAVARSRGPLDCLEAAQVLALRDEGPRGRTETGRSRSSTVDRQALAARVDAMGALLRDLGVLTTRADRRRLANQDLASRLDGMVPAFDGERLSRAFAAVDRARLALDRNAGQKIVADWLVLNL